MSIKRAWSIIVIAISLATLLTSCSPSSDEVQMAIEQTSMFESQIQTAIAKTLEAMEEESDQTQTPTIEIEPTSTIKPSQTPKPSATIKPTDRPETINYNQEKTITNFCKFELTNMYFANKILPPNTSGYYRYYEAKSSDSTYLDVVMTIKNLDSSIKSAEDFVSVKAVYDNNYTYNSFAVLVGPDGSFNMGFYGIDPLVTSEVHHLISVPVEVENSSKSLVIIFQAKDKEYHFVIR